MPSRLSRLWLGALLLGLATLPAFASNRAPLTPQVENAFVAFTEWVYNVRLSASEKDQVLAVFRKEWLGPNETDYQNLKNVIALYENVTRMSKREAVSKRNMFFSLFWPATDANRDRPDVNAVMTAYLRQHRILADGHPPLSEEIADAKARYVQFTLEEGSGGVIRLDLEALKKELAESYSSLSAEEQKATVHAMGQWAEIQYGWPNMSESERNGHRRKWRAHAAQLYPNAVAQMPPLPGEAQTNASGSSGQKSVMGLLNQYQENRQKIEEERVAEMEAALRSIPEPVEEPSTGNPELDRYRAAQRKMMMDQMKTQMISNMLNARHQANMGIIRNMPGSPRYKWVWTYQ